MILQNKIIIEYGFQEIFFLINIQLLIFLYFRSALVYYDSAKLYTANYSSFYPNTKNGEFISYYTDGNIRQIIVYKNNKPKEVKTFDKVGTIKSHYQYIETKNTTTSEIDIDIKYISVIDSLGNNLIESGNKSSLVVIDDFANVTYTNKYYNKELISSYRLINGDTVFQLTNPDYNFKIKSLQKKFNYYMTEKEYNEALSVNAQGIILMALVIDNKGYTVECSVLNSIHPEIDKLVNNFINSRLLPKAEYRYKFKPYKKDKTKQFCEVVIPIEFSINRFYRQPVNYNHFHHMHWQMHQQQMMMNNFKPPTMPTGF